MTFRYIYILLITITLTGGSAMAQVAMSGGTKVMIQKGDDYYKTSKYSQAIQEYKKALKVDKRNNDVKLKIADSYFNLHDYQNARTWYSDAMTLDGDYAPRYYKHYAEILKIDGQYEEAAKWLAKYNELVTDDDRAQKELVTLQNINYYFQDTVKYHLQNMYFNTKDGEFGPHLYRGEVVYLSNRHKKKSEGSEVSFIDIYAAPEEDDTNTTGDDVYPFLDKKDRDFHEGPFTLYSRSSKILLTRSVEVGSKKQSSKKLKIFEGEWGGSDVKWTNFKQLPIVGANEVAGHPAVSEDGKTLYFISDKEGGFGKADLYVTTKTGETWSEPKNLGDHVNTTGNELFPYLLGDSVLYFASNGHAGLGGLDVYKYYLKGPEKGRISNVGYPLNSNGDDFGISFSDNGNYGYITSNRKGGKGGDDIYRFKVNRIKQVMMEGFTKDPSGNSVNMKGVKIYDEITGETLGFSDESGYFRAVLDNKREYRLMAEATEKPSFFQIHFEGFVKDHKDTSHVVDLTVKDQINQETVARNEDDGYVLFDIEEGVLYDFEAHIANETGLKLSEIRLEGFLSERGTPHIGFGEMHVIDGDSKERLFTSDRNGFFNFKLDDSKDYLIKAVRKTPEDYFEMKFEGFVKDRHDTSNVVKLHIFEMETGEEVYRSEEGGYMSYILDKNKNYDFKATVNDSSVSLADIRVEGFMLNVDDPVIIDDVSFKDDDNGDEENILFKSDNNGFLSFPMEPNKDYHLSMTKPVAEQNFLIGFEGFIKDVDDTAQKPHITLLDPNTMKPMGESENGYFEFEIEEDVGFSLKADVPEFKIDPNLLAPITFEGFVSDPELKVGGGKVNIVDAQTQEVLYTTDETGFFSMELDPLRDYDFVAHSMILDEAGAEIIDTAVGPHHHLMFSGIVKEEPGIDNRDDASIEVTDPETGENLVTNDDGLITFQLEKNKVYEVETDIPSLEELLATIVDSSALEAPIKDDVVDSTQNQPEQPIDEPIVENPEIDSSAVVDNTPEQPIDTTTEEPSPEPDPLSKLSSVVYMVAQKADWSQFFMEEIESLKLYEVYFDSEGGYYTNGITQTRFTEKSPDNLDEDRLKEFLESQDIKVDGVREITPVFFGFDSEQLTSYGRNEVDELAQLLKKFDKLQVTLTGHADTRGSLEYNISLTRRRNEAVKKYLVEQGIDPSRIKTQALGESKSTDCESCDEDQHSKNRRTDFEVKF